MGLPFGIPDAGAKGLRLKDTIHPVLHTLEPLIRSQDSVICEVDILIKLDRILVCLRRDMNIEEERINELGVYI